MKSTVFPVSGSLRAALRARLRGAFPALGIAVFAGLFSFAGNLSAQNQVRHVPWATPYYTYELQSDIVYGQGKVNGGSGLKNLTLDLYIPDIPPPANGVNKLALMVMIHGGGFSIGSKNNPNILLPAPTTKPGKVSEPRPR